MYQALYRKYRPVDFDSVVGQDAIIRTLKNSIINNNFSHAYMFFGPRGTGKTTVSKIFARNINCMYHDNGIACLKCEHCKVSFSKDCIDIIEIDAASNNGVDEIRDLKNKIYLVPSELKYKVYIIDEVHMLSIGAFNALLKTLEEPPEHAIFILATTDPQKVPETIISRCQCFSFKRISNSVIKKRLEVICNEEKIDIEEEVLDSIAILSDGGLRDALGLLDKLVSYTNDKIEMDDFIEINGIISSKEIDEFIGKIMIGDIPGMLKDIDSFDTNGKNLIQILIQILNHCRNMIVDNYLVGKEIEFPLSKIQIFTNLLNEKMFDLKKSSNTRIFMEILILKFINDNILYNRVDDVLDKNKNNFVKENITNNGKNNNSVDTAELSQDIVSNSGGKYSEKEVSDSDLKLSSNSIDDSYEKKPKIINIDEIMKVRVNNTLALANKKLLNDEIKKFEKLKDFTFDQEIGYIVCSLLDSKLRAVSNDNLIISFEFDSTVEQNLLILDKIIDVYNKITLSNKQIAIISDREWEDVKNQYIYNLKNNIKYEVISEPIEVLENIKKDDIISSSAVDLFGDIVEYE